MELEVGFDVEVEVEVELGTEVEAELGIEESLTTAECSEVLVVPLKSGLSKSQPLSVKRSPAANTRTGVLKIDLIIGIPSLYYNS